MCRKPDQSRKGAVAVEFAITLPLLTMLVLGAIDASNLLFVRQTLCNASYEGARRATSGLAAADDAPFVVRRFLDSAGLNKATIRFNPANPLLADAGDRVTVTTQIPADMVTILPSSMFSGAMVTGSCTMTKD